MSKPVRLFLIFFLQLFALSVSGIHIKGGWMSYDFLGTATNGFNQYRVTIKVYRDCAPGNPGQNDPSIIVSFHRVDTRARYTEITATQTNIYRLEKGSFNECINPRPDVCYVILEYTGTVDLPGTPAGYTGSFQRCCRVGGIVNVAQPSNTFGNTYTISFPGTTNNTGNVANPTRNSSPKFVEKDTVAICYNSPFELDYSAIDADGDSLVFSFTSALIGANTGMPAPTTSPPPPYTSITYQAGYTAGNPFGTNISINPQTGLITGTSPSLTGEYVLAVAVSEFRNGQWIADTRKEIHVSVAACSQVGADLPLDIINCDGFNVQFENLSPSSNVQTYHWDFGVTNILNDTSRVARPVYTYSDTGIYTAKLIVNKFGPCADSATTQVRVFPNFNPDFTWNGSCFSNPFQFNNTSTATYGNVTLTRWDFGVNSTSNDTSRLNNPVFTFPAPGQYQVFLAAQSSKGCSDTVSKTIQVLDRPLLNLPFKDTLICSIDTLQLIANGTGIFTWTPVARMLNESTGRPLVFPLSTTTYTVNLNDRGCIATDTIRVNVLNSITVNAGADTTICLGDGFVLMPVTQGLGFRWSPAATLSNPNVKSPLARPTDIYTTYFLLANLGKCTASDEITVHTVPYPQANAGADTAICFGEKVTLRGNLVGSSFQWSPAGLTDFPFRLTTGANPTQTTAFVLTVTDTLGCPKPMRDTVLVRVIAPIQVFAGNDTNLVIGQTLALNGIANATQFLWSPPVGLSNVNIANPVVQIQAGMLPAGVEEIRYILTVSSPEGCASSDDIVIRVFKTLPSLFIPNAFTPNGDGKNDLIRPILAGIKQFNYFRIYNRYGQLIYETRQPGAGWDGRVNGQLQASAAFVYDCQAIDYTDKRLIVKGSFLLIR